MDKILQWKQKVLFLQADVDGHVKPRSACNGTFAAVVAGHGRTDANGRWEMVLPVALCPAPEFPIDNRPSFVATPTDESEPQAVVLSAAITGTFVIVQTWTLGGGTAPGIAFSWHCIFETHGI
jgi:hypothetical protein